MVDDNLLTDTRDGHMAPGRAGDVLRNADPAGAVFVLLALAIPGELHLHAAVFVGKYFLIFWADHGGVLRTVDQWFAQRLSAPLGIVRHQFGLVAVVGAELRLGAFFSLTGVLLAVVDDAHRTPATVQVFPWVARESEGDTRLQARIIALDQGHACIAPMTT